MIPIAASLSLIITMAGFFALWLISLRTRNAAVADVYWGPGFIVIAVVSLIVNGAISLNQIALASLVGLWGLRLGLHLWLRHRAAIGEDQRYARMRERGGKNWPIKSLFTIFFVQAIVQWLIALPIHFGTTPLANALPSVTGRVGILIFAAGMTLETLADAALQRFKRNPQNSGKLLTTGVFSWCRHPNYFGEILVWAGLALFAYSASGAAIVFLSPVLLAFLIARASGVPMLEDVLKDREGFDAWKARTNALIPWPPKPEKFR